MAKLQITAAQGPVECQRAVALALELLRNEAKQAGLKMRCLMQEKTAYGLQSAVLEILGEGCQAFIQANCGTWQWIWQSRLRPHQQRKNWFIGIFALEQETPNPQTLRLSFQACKASGKGGQHLNKTNSAVWLSDGNNVRIKVQQERSQAANKRLALRQYTALMQKREQAQQQNHSHKQWQQHWQLERGKPCRVFIGDDFKEK